MGDTQSLKEKIRKFNAITLRRVVLVKVTPSNAPWMTPVSMAIMDIGFDDGSGKITLLLKRDGPDGGKHFYVQEKKGPKNMFVFAHERNAPQNQDPTVFYIGGLRIRSLLR